MFLKMLIAFIERTCLPEVTPIIHTKASCIGKSWIWEVYIFLWRNWMRFYFRDPKFCTLNPKKPPFYLNLCTVRMRFTKFLSHLPLSRNSGYGNNWFQMGPVVPWTCSSPLKAEGGFISMRRAPKEKPFCIYCFSKAAVICPTSRILHCSMQIFQRDNFSTISTPASNRKPLWPEPQGAIRCAKLNNGSMLRPGSFTINNTPWSSRPAWLSTQHLVPSLPGNSSRYQSILTKSITYGLRR